MKLVHWCPPHFQHTNTFIHGEIQQHAATTAAGCNSGRILAMAADKGTNERSGDHDIRNTRFRRMTEKLRLG